MYVCYLYGRWAFIAFWPGGDMLKRILIFIVLLAAFLGLGMLNYSRI
jgi:hypothetical protein